MAKTIIVYDLAGQHLATVTPGVAERAVARGEIARTGPSTYALRPSAVERYQRTLDEIALSPEALRRYNLAKAKR